MMKRNEEASMGTTSEEQKRWRTRLLLVRTVVSHAYPGGVCPDGLAAALIIADAYRRLPEDLYDVEGGCPRVRLLSHGTPAYEHLDAEPGMLFVDLTPPARSAARFAEAGALVLDHHQDREALVASFGDLGRFAHEERDPGVSGAVLAFRHVWLPLRTFFRPWLDEQPSAALVERFANLAGVRDTWRTTEPTWPEACEQAAVLRFFDDLEDWLDPRRPSPLEPARLSERLKLGPHLTSQAERRTASLVEGAYRFRSRGRRVVVLPTTQISDAAERLSADADLVVGFSYGAELGRPVLRLSFRSAHLDVSRIAAPLGGGGHRGAAGARVEIPDPAESAHPPGGASRNPYRFVADLLERGLLEQEGT